MADDRSLLDRLNALKPTSEDALSARLRTLRNASASASPRPPPRDFGTPSPGSEVQPQLLRDISTSSLSHSHVSTHLPEGQPEDGDVDLDPLFHADDRTLDEFLETLNLDDDVSLDQNTPLTLDPNDETKKVAALLEELGKPATDLSRHDKDDRDDDDSEGEQMSVEVRKLLSQALDEAELDRSLSAQEPSQDEAQHPSSRPKAEAGTAQPPSLTQRDDTGHPSKPDDTDAFSLPTVPSELVDPIPSASQDEPADFDSSIAARMAALKGISYGTSNTDTFGLPQAPSFDPDARTEPRPSFSSSFAGKLRGGYTDEDQKTWCVVCLEDATIRCVGCDDDVYCGRCWRDMHVGPRAGYDERGHQWVRFERFGRRG